MLQKFLEYELILFLYILCDVWYVALSYSQCCVLMNDATLTVVRGVGLRWAITQKNLSIKTIFLKLTISIHLLASRVAVLSAGW